MLLCGLYVLMHIQLRVLECLGLTADGGERDKNCMCLKVPSCPKNVYLVRTTAWKSRTTLAFKSEENHLSFSLEGPLKQINSN